MKQTLQSLLIVAAASLSAPGRVPAQTPVGTGFTYQGQLKKGGIPVNAACDFELSL